MTKQRFTDATSDALTALLNADPFHSAMLLDMELHECTDRRGEPMPTACTDGFRNIWVNPDFMATLTPEEGAFVIAHEVQHKLLMYPIRFKDMQRMNRLFSPQLFNVAQDFHINSQLDHAGYPVANMGATKGCFTVQTFINAMQAQMNGEDMANHKGGFMFDPSVRTTTTTESLYNQLVQALPPPKDDDGGGGAGAGMGGIAGGENGEGAGNDVDMRDFDETLESEGMTEGQAEEQMLNEILSAAQSAESRSPGCLPANVQGMLDEYSKPYVNWKSKLRRFINGTARDDWSYRRPNRRSAGSRIIQPSLFSESVGPIAVIVDTSGSVSDVELAQGLAEISDISKRVKPESIVVISIDTTVNAVDRYQAGQRITTLQTNGRGGTNMDPAFDWINNEGLRPECIICLTDGEFSPPARSKVKSPVMWAICNPYMEAKDFKETFTYGQIIEVKVTD